MDTSGYRRHAEHSMTSAFPSSQEELDGTSRGIFKRPPHGICQWLLLLLGPGVTTLHCPCK